MLGKERASLPYTALISSRWAAFLSLFWGQAGVYRDTRLSCHLAALVFEQKVCRCCSMHSCDPRLSQVPPSVTARGQTCCAAPPLISRSSVRHPNGSHSKLIEHIWIKWCCLIPSQWHRLCSWQSVMLCGGSRQMMDEDSRLTGIVPHMGKNNLNPVLASWSSRKSCSSGRSIKLKKGWSLKMTSFSWKEKQQKKNKQHFSVTDKVPRMLFCDDLITYQMKLVHTRKNQWLPMAVSKLHLSIGWCTPLFPFWNDCPIGPKMAKEIHTMHSQDPAHSSSIHCHC